MSCSGASTWLEFETKETNAELRTFILNSAAFEFSQLRLFAYFIHSFILSPDKRGGE